MIVTLACQHMRLWTRPESPELLSEVSCTVCGTFEYVTQIDEEYRIKCIGCGYSRKYGAALLTARHAADRHHRNRPAHTIQILLGAKIVDVRRGVVNVLFEIDAPPF